MSFDPENPDERVRPGRSWEQEPGFEPPSRDPYATRPSGQKATLPGVFLIVVGILNLIAAGLSGLMAYQFSVFPEAELQKAFEQQQRQSEQNRQALKQYNINSGEDLRKIYVYGGTTFALVGGLPSLLTILGGVFMCLRKARWLSILGALIAVVPCLSPSACCLFGMGVGIWALVVLFSADVKAAFH
jgi:hypothetical protein